MIRPTPSFRRSAAVLLLAAAGLAPDFAAPVEAQQKDHERVRELEQELRLLKARMRAIAVRADGRRTPYSVSRTRKRVEVLIDGQVHRAILLGATRRDTQVIHADGDQSSTRIRFRGKARAPGGWRVDARIEFEFQSNPSDRTDDAAGVEAMPSLRKARIRFRHARWGAIAIGRESTATSGITSLDLSGSRLAMYSKVITAGGGFRHTNSALDPPAGGTAVNQVWDTFDGASRDDLLRYDTPQWYGFWVSVSFAQADTVHAAVRYVGHPFGIQAIRLAAGFGWVYTPGAGSTAPGFSPGGVSNEYAGSASLLHVPSGVSVTWAMGTKVLAASGPGRNVPNPWSAYLKLGWQSKAILPRLGRTAVAVDLFRARDLVPGARFRGFGLALLQRVEAAAADIYIVYRLYDLLLARSPSRGQSTLHVVMMGSRVKF